MAIEIQSLRPLRPNLKGFKWLRVFGPHYGFLGLIKGFWPSLRVFGPQCRVSIALTFAWHYNQKGVHWISQLNYIITCCNVINNVRFQ